MPLCFFQKMRSPGLFYGSGLREISYNFPCYRLILGKSLNVVLVIITIYSAKNLRDLKKTVLTWQFESFVYFHFEIFQFLNILRSFQVSLK